MNKRRRVALKKRRATRERLKAKERAVRQAAGGTGTAATGTRRTNTAST
jgi:hypothetical protein